MNDELKKKLSQYSLEPPKEVWHRLEEVLKGEVASSWVHKLADTEVTPPKDAWAHIVTALSNPDKGIYVSKLRELSVAPPQNTWEEIESTFQEANRPVIYVQRKVSPRWRYAAAAVLLVLMALGGVSIFRSQTKERPSPGISRATVTKPDTAKGIPFSTNTPTALSNYLPAEGKLLAINSEVKKKRNFSSLGRIVKILSPALINDVTASDCAFQEAVLHGNVPGNCSLISDSDPYLLFMNPNGYLIRISKKLAQTLGCAYSNGNSDEYHRCEHEIKKWSDKLAQSPTNTSSDNFTNVLDILKSVQN